MNRGLIASMLQGFAKQKIAQNADSKEEELLSLADAEQEEIDEAFLAATPIATYLCYPMQFNYEDDDGSTIIRLVALKEIRKAGADYLFRCMSDEDKGHRIFASSRMSTVTAGQTGYKVEDFAAFAKRFEHFKDNDFVDIRRALHIMLFLARSDGRYLPSEKKIVADFIHGFCTQRKEDPKRMDDYLNNAFIHYNVFMEAVRELGKISDEDMQAIVSTARQLIQADLATAKDEERFYQQLEQAIRSAA
ncbi:MAG: hypothetical protein J0L97_10325 [Alphaproteobacteria bacterium]|nr:hypothetical protein [Alphaproteobacteria bacterium]